MFIFGTELTRLSDYSDEVRNKWEDFPILVLSVYWKVPRDCLENLPMRGPSWNQTFLWVCATQESPITLETFLRQTFQDNSFTFSTVPTRASLTNKELLILLSKSVCKDIWIRQTLPQKAITVKPCESMVCWGLSLPVWFSQACWNDRTETIAGYCIGRQCCG